MIIQKTQNEIISVPDKLSVFSDKRTGFKTVAFPIKFPNGIAGVVSITRVWKGDWNPFNDIEEINIKWKNL